jgi:hypothetical protein
MPQFTRGFDAAQVQPFSPGRAYQEGKANKQRYEFNQQRMKSMEQQQRMGEQTIEQNDMALKGQKEKKWVMGAIQKIQGHQGSSPEEKKAAMGELKQKFPQVMQEVEQEQQDQRIKDMTEEGLKMSNLAAQIKGLTDAFSGANTQEQIDEVNGNLADDSPYKNKVKTIKDLDAFREDSPVLADLQANAAAAVKASAEAPDDKAKMQEAALRSGLVKAEEQRVQYARQLAELDLAQKKASIEKDLAAAAKSRRETETGGVESKDSALIMRAVHKGYGGLFGPEGELIPLERGIAREAQRVGALGEQLYAASNGKIGQQTAAEMARTMHDKEKGKQMKQLREAFIADNEREPTEKELKAAYQRLVIDDTFY